MNLDQFTSSGKFLMLALDHRQGIRKILNPQNPEIVPEETIIKLKSEIIDALKEHVTGILIDQEYGLPAYKDRTKPFLLPLEKTGFVDQEGERITELEHSVSQIKEAGANGAKLLLYFNPNVPSSKQQLETAKKVISECKTHDFPLFLEIVTYGGEGLVVESVKMFVQNGVVPDVFKVEYPGTEEGCKLVTGVLGSIPWILLTGGDSFDIFKEHVAIAISAGAKGFLAGRGLWQEAATLIGEEKMQFLAKTLPERFEAIAKIAKEA